MVFKNKTITENPKTFICKVCKDEYYSFVFKNLRRLICRSCKVLTSFKDKREIEYICIVCGQNQTTIGKYINLKKVCFSCKRERKRKAAIAYMHNQKKGK